MSDKIFGVLQSDVTHCTLQSYYTRDWERIGVKNEKLFCFSVRFLLLTHLKPTFPSYVFALLVYMTDNITIDGLLVIKKKENQLPFSLVNGKKNQKKKKNV